MLSVPNWLQSALLQGPIFLLNNILLKMQRSGVILQRLWFNLMQFICQATGITNSAKSFRQIFMGLWDEYEQIENVFFFKIF